MSITYVFAINNIYNVGTIKRVRWWNRLFGFPGLTVVARCEMVNLTYSTKDSFNIAKSKFEALGFHEQIVGERI